MNNTALELLISATLCLALVAGALTYLRSIAKRVLLELCHSDVGAEFWMRSAEILALAGSLIMVMALGVHADFLDTIRYTVALSLAGLFVSVVFISSSVWRSVDRSPAEVSRVKLGAVE